MWYYPCTSNQVVDYPSCRLGLGVARGNSAALPCRAAPAAELLQAISELTPHHSIRSNEYGSGKYGIP